MELNEEKYDFDEDIINEVLNKLTDNKKLKVNNVFPYDNNFKSFKIRYNLYKKILKDNLPDFSFEEIVKIHFNYQKIRENLSCINGFDIALYILNEEVKKQKVIIK